MPNRKELSDPQLVLSIKSGDIQSFDILFRRYYPLMYAFVNKMLKDGEWADDITQNIFIKLWLYRSELNPDKSVKELLYKMARNKCIDYFRSVRDEIRLLVSIKDGDNDPADSSQCEDSIQFKETGIAIASNIAMMPNKRQMVFKMSRYMHLPNKEIARRLGISVRTVEKHLELAVKGLRQSIS